MRYSLSIEHTWLWHHSIGSDEQTRVLRVQYMRELNDRNKTHKALSASRLLLRSGVPIDTRQVSDTVHTETDEVEDAVSGRIR